MDPENYDGFGGVDHAEYCFQVNSLYFMFTYVFETSLTNIPPPTVTGYNVWLKALPSKNHFLFLSLHCKHLQASSHGLSLRFLKN